MNPAHDERDGGAGQPALLVLGSGTCSSRTMRSDSNCSRGSSPTGLRGRATREIEFVDGGTQGLALLGVISGRRALLVLDAVGLGAAPGTVHAMTGEEVLAMHFTRPDTAHDGGAGQLLAIASLVGDLPRSVTVIGIEPGRVATGLGFSESVRAALPAAVARAKLAAIELRARVAGAAGAAEAPCTN